MPCLVINPYRLSNGDPGTQSQICLFAVETPVLLQLQCHSLLEHFLNYCSKVSVQSVTHVLGGLLIQVGVWLQDTQVGSQWAWYRQGALLFPFFLFQTVEVFKVWLLLIIVHCVGWFGMKLCVCVLIHVMKVTICNVTFGKCYFVKIDAWLNMSK